MLEWKHREEWKYLMTKMALYFMSWLSEVALKVPICGNSRQYGNILESPR